MNDVQGPSEPGGPTAPEPASGQLPGQAPAGSLPGTGGAGLYDHAAADPFPRSAGLVSGIVALGVTVAVAATFFFLNPAFSAGRAGGAPDQVGPRPSPSVSAGPAGAAVSGSPSPGVTPAVSPAALGSPSPALSPAPVLSPAAVSASPSPASR
jgi:hypothetical protein